jgi:hypothetical protein
MSNHIFASPVLFTRTKFRDYSLRLGPTILDSGGRLLALQTALAPDVVAGGPKHHTIMTPDSGTPHGHLILFSEPVTAELLGLPANAEALDEHGRTLKMTYGVYATTPVRMISKELQAEIRKIAATKLQSIWEQQISNFEESPELSLSVTGTPIEIQEGEVIEIAFVARKSSPLSAPLFSGNSLTSTSRSIGFCGWLQNIWRRITGKS